AFMDRQTVARNSRFLVLEIFWAALFMGCVAFVAAYIIRLGGSNLLVSLLTAGAALVNALAALPFAAFLEGRARRRPWIIGSLAVVRLGHLGLIAVPYLAGEWAPGAAVLLLVALNVPVALFTAGFLPMLADVVPLERRARVFSARNITLGATAAVTTFSMGLWLDRAPFPLNYQLLFAFGVVASCISTLYVARLAIPDSAVVRSEGRQRLSITTLREALRGQRPFTNLMVNTLIFNLAFWMAVPLQPIYFVRVLGASDAWIGLFTALVSGGTILGSLLWERQIRRLGFGGVLLRAALLSALYYLLIGLFPNLWVILLCGLFFGIVSSGVDLCHFNMLLEVCPPERRAFYIGLFVTVMNIGFCVAPLAVAPLTELIGARALVLALAGLRLGGALLFVANPVAARNELPELRELPE
ncbi:MAG: MFS transporter, partial [Chloroflexales bacterium]|nr:MFS transporter [Chloroflexales bacterium]